MEQTVWKGRAESAATLLRPRKRPVMSNWFRCLGARDRDRDGRAVGVEVCRSGKNRNFCAKPVEVFIARHSINSPKLGDAVGRPCCKSAEQLHRRGRRPRGRRQKRCKTTELVYPGWPGQPAFTLFHKHWNVFRRLSRGAVAVSKTAWARRTSLKVRVVVRSKAGSNTGYPVSCLPIACAMTGRLRLEGTVSGPCRADAIQSRGSVTLASRRPQATRQDFFKLQVTGKRLEESAISFASPGESLPQTRFKTLRQTRDPSRG